MVVLEGQDQHRPLNGDRKGGEVAACVEDIIKCLWGPMRAALDVDLESSRGRIFPSFFHRTPSPPAPESLVEQRFMRSRRHHHTCI